MRIVIIGARGVGKSSVGKLLAQRLDCPFYDIDELIMAAAGKTIAAIVATGGWESFRDWEKRILARTAAAEGKGEMVIAVGGGAVMAAENQSIIKKMDLIVWLKAPVETIVARIRSDKDSPGKRPPLLGGDTDTEAQALLAQRQAIYRKLANLTVSTKSKNAQEVAHTIVEKIRKGKTRKGLGNGRQLHRTII